MHEQNLENMREEAVRLMAIIEDRLCKIQKHPELLQKSQGSLSTDGISRELEKIAGEKYKLEHFEIVLAVVGTMKAGKSTTINAIVGSEVLPNRNRPMTSLPTLIRHTPGQKEPRLVFTNNEPLQKHIQALAVAIHKTPKEIESLVTTEKEIQPIIQAIFSGKPVQTVYEGRQSIYEFLVFLNDIVRISKALQLEFPFVNYDEIHELPVIEIEFSHLEGVSSNSGRLTLLDTPGPNEAKQPHLRKMLRDQLSKASAVLAVLDYTQLKSDADHEVRGMVEELGDKNRLYVIVNKFDQRDRNSDNAEDVQKHVAEHLLKGSVKSENVFPVSSNQAYLANCAQRHIQMFDSLPTFIENDPATAWLADFGDEAFGKKWQKRIDDAQEVKEAITELWNDSLFQKPLASVVHSSHANAAVIAMESASKQALDISTKIDQFLGTQETALTKQAEELTALIQAIKQDIQDVAEKERDATKLTKKLQDRFQKSIASDNEEIQETLQKLLTDYFKTGKMAEKKRQQEKSETQTKTKSWLASLLDNRSNKSVHSETEDFQANSSIIQFSEKAEATEFVKQVQSRIIEVCDVAMSGLEERVGALVGEFQSEFESKVQTPSQEILSRCGERMREQGFSLVFHVPSMPNFQKQYKKQNWFGSAIEERVETRTGTRVKDSTWSRFKNWFSSDWGTETYSYETKSIEVNIKQLKSIASVGVKELMENIEESIASKLQAPLESSMNDFFAELSSKMEEVRADLNTSLQAKARDKDFQIALKKKLAELRNGIAGVIADSDCLYEECLSMRKNTQVAVP